MSGAALVATAAGAHGLFAFGLVLGFGLLLCLGGALFMRRAT